MYVKICGLRDEASAHRAASAGADAVGVVMSPASPRHASDDDARVVLSAARAVNPEIDTVLVVNRMPAAEAAQRAQALGFTVLQLHGAYTRDDFEAARSILPRIWRAVSPSTADDLVPGAFGEERLLLDSPSPGSGERWELDGALQSELRGRDWMLAGGLSPENVAAAITELHPTGVDVSSGVEDTPGVKSLAKIDAFVSAARAAIS